MTNRDNHPPPTLGGKILIPFKRSVQQAMNGPNIIPRKNLAQVLKKHRKY